MDAARFMTASLRRNFPFIDIFQAARLRAFRQAGPAARIVARRDDPWAVRPQVASRNLALY
jgi:hypothetical protein